MSSGQAVELDGIVKSYRLFRKPIYRFLDLFGLCPPGPAYFTDHFAVDEVTLSIPRGQKVAIIGRNGAGKSTLLKVVTGLVRPTRGTARVSGRVSNLLQIGSGFHPDFTGRQNVFANLAHQGITGAEASRVFDEVVDFAEIGEYIDQPMKTYSTGMCSRLMFSSSIVVKPDILIVDEILGVGDAYFSHKSFERMRQLCTRDGTTLLLVTHDIYSAQNLCDRFIWIDRGLVKYDGDGKTAVAMYETSIKEQEEQARSRRAVRMVGLSAGPSTETLTVTVRSHTGFALERPLGIAGIDLVDAAGRLESLDIAEPRPPWHSVPDSNLGPVEQIDGYPCRALRPFGSIFHKAEWIVTLPASAADPIVEARIRWRYVGRDEAELVVAGSDRRPIVRGALRGGIGWQQAAFPAGIGPIAEAVQTEFGSAAVRIGHTQFLDRSGAEVDRVRHGDPLTIRVALEVNDRAVRDISFVVAFTRQGTSYAINVVDHHLRLPDAEQAIVDVHLPTVRLGSGSWLLRIGVAEADVFTRGTLRYFAIDDRWYHLMRDGIPFEVTSADQLDSAGCFAVHDGRFAARPADLSSPSQTAEPVRTSGS